MIDLPGWRTTTRELRGVDVAECHWYEAGYPICGKGLQAARPPEAEPQVRQCPRCRELLAHRARVKREGSND